MIDVSKIIADAKALHDAITAAHLEAQKLKQGNPAWLQAARGAAQAAIEKLNLHQQVNNAQAAAKPAAA